MTVVAETGEGLLLAICMHPDDLDRRLIYADWLEENGQQERAEFIRVQMGIARMRAHGFHGFSDPRPLSCPDCQEIVRLEQREQQLMEGALIVWNDMPGWVSEWVFEAGMVQCIWCKMQDWLAHGPAFIRAHPLHRVTITDRTPDEEGDWRGDTFYSSYCWGVEEGPEVPPWRLPHDIAGEMPRQYVGLAYRFQADAMTALSIGCIRWARHENGLDPMPLWCPPLPEGLGFVSRPLVF